MLAMVLGLLLVGAAAQVFLASRATFRFNQNLATLQDNARFVLYRLGHDLRRGGYTGCPQSLRPVHLLAKSLLTAQRTDRGPLPAAAIAAPDTWLPRRAMSASDAILVGYMRDFGVRVTGSTEQRLELSANPVDWGGHYSEDILLVTDCRQSVLVATGGQRNSSACMGDVHAIELCSELNVRVSGFDFPDKARVLAPYEVIYYIGRTSRLNDAGEHVLSLYQLEAYPATTRSQELVPNISHLTVRYGVRRDRHANSVQAYVPADEVTDWHRVVAVRLGFVATSPQSVGAASPGWVQMFGQRIAVPDDGHIRKVFSSAVALRNKGIEQ